MPQDIIITPGSSVIQFISATGSVGTITQSEGGAVVVGGTGVASNPTIFAIDGGNGRLFEVDDDLSDTIFSANTIAGLPVIEAFADGTVKLGTYNNEGIIVGGTGPVYIRELYMDSLPAAGDTTAVVYNTSTKQFGYNTIAGPQGAKGAQGSAGTNGSNGAQGAAGTNGSNGAQGAAGTNGSNGSNGAQGAAGTNGSNGSNGAQGDQGFRGASDWTPVLENGVEYGVDSTTFIKNSGNNATWDGHAYSIQGYTRGAYVTARATSDQQYIMWGLNTDPNNSPDYSNIDWAWYFQQGGGLSIYESGGGVGNFGAYDINTVCTITYDGTDIRYFKDGVEVRRVTTSIGSPLYFDSSSYFVNGEGIRNVGFGPMGAKGDTGTQGAKGSQGSAGTNGSNGAQGSAGTNGSNGSNGAQGAAGTNGSNGTNGTNGAQGFQGPPGSGSVPGNDADIIFNQGGALNGSGYFVWDYNNRFLGIGGGGQNYPITVTNENGGVSIYAQYDIVAFSDARVKTNIKGIPDALAKVNAMRGVTYERIDLESSDRFMGVIAQEVLPHAPEVVYQKPDGTYAVAYQNLVGLLIEAINELTERVKVLEARDKTTTNE